MNEQKFVILAKEAVTEYIMDRQDATNAVHVCVDDVFVVWMCKTLQNNKALLSTTLADGMYYEITYNGDKCEMYLDAYKKWENVCIKLPKE